MMTFGEERADCPSILTLPDDVLYAILRHCPVNTLGRLAATCRRIARLVIHDSVWKTHLNGKTLVHSYGRRERLSARELCRLAQKWKSGPAREYRVIHHRVKQMPWIQLCDDHFWISYKNVIRCYRQKQSGRLGEDAGRLLRGGVGDVGRFVAKDGLLVTGYRDGSISAFHTDSGQQVCYYHACHRSDIHSVDFHQNTIVSGCRDATVKVWDMQARQAKDAFKYQVDIHDRVWSVAVNPTGESFVVGSAGIHQVSPLRMWHTESGQLLCSLGSDYRHGAGVLDLQYESPNLLFSCGYDTFIRLWDFRQSCTQCVAAWEEPFDSTIYCVKSDNNHALLAGTARHGMVRLWDKRMTQSVQMYYCGRVSSPVYSLAFDASRLYIALDKGINMLDFSG